MRLPIDVSRGPLFLRIFVLMLFCVGVVQLLNLALLIAVQTPTSRVSTVGEIVEVVNLQHDPNREFGVRIAKSIEPSDWNPRAEQLQLTLANVLEIPKDWVDVNFPHHFFQREKVYDREGVPPPVAISPEEAHNAILIGDFTVSVRQPDGTWLVVRSIEGFGPWRWFALLWLGLSAVAVVPFAWALARRLTKPIATFAEAAERLGRDPRTAPIELDGPVEITEAAAAFNRMQARLNRYIDDRALVVGALAHDLRTPLMRLGLRLETAPEELQSACEGDIRDMEHMVAATLNYVRDTNATLDRRPLELRSLVETLIDDLSDHGANVALSPGDPVVLQGNSAALKAMVGNLVDNAIKYAGGADVDIIPRGDHVAIHVRDNGPGMSPEDLDRVFEPFFRGERSRNRDTGGIGLGIPSARANALAHGGDLAFENRPDGGLMAKVTLPI